MRPKEISLSMKCFSHPVVQIRALHKCLICFTLLYQSFSFSQNSVIKEVTKINKVDIQTECENNNNCVISCFDQDSSNVIDSDYNGFSINQTQIFIKLSQLSNFNVHNKDIIDAILIKLPYELNRQLILKTLPSLWTYDLIPIDTNFIYFIQRNLSNKCTKEERLTQFKNAYLKCLELIQNSEKSTEYLTYKSKELLKVNEDINNELRILKTRLDTFDLLMANMIENQNIKFKPKNILNIEFEHSIYGFRSSENNILIDNINLSSIGIKWLFLAKDKLKIGFVISHHKNQFNTFREYDSIFFSSQTNMGIPFVKSIITRDLLEVNKYTSNSVLLNFGYVAKIKDDFSFDMNMNLSYSPKFNITSMVSKGTVDYLGYISTVNEPLSNLSDLGLKSNVNMVNLEDQTYFSSFCFTLQPSIGYEWERFYSRFGFSFSHLKFWQRSSLETATTTSLGDYHSSISQISNFKLNTLNLSLTVGIRL